MPTKISGEVEVLNHTIEFYYDVGTKLSPEAKNILTCGAESRATEMIIEGYNSGELCSVITGKRSEKEYHGWWSIKKEPVSFDVLVSFDAYGCKTQDPPKPKLFRVSHKKNIIPSVSDWKNDCFLASEAFDRIMRRACISLPEFLADFIDRKGWVMEQKHIETLTLPEIKAKIVIS